MDQWAYQHGVALHFIERGKPTQNALIESFNGKFRDECLNQNWFTDLTDARRIIEARGNTVEDARGNRHPTGYDLIARRDAEELKIKVKPCSRLWNVPDLLPGDLDAEKRLVADFLYVVYAVDAMEPRLCIIPRDAIRPEHLLHISRYAVSKKFQNEQTLKPLLHTI